MTAVGYLCAIQPQRMEGSAERRKVRLAETIDTWVLSASTRAAATSRFLKGCTPHMDTFKQLLDTCTRLEMTLLAQRYDGFYRFANLLERLAQAIADGVIEVPPDAPLPDSQEPGNPGC
ncbi:MAG: arylsulfatase regulator [bacterium]|nr:arylsulfatase regulator [bacterium]